MIENRIHQLRPTLPLPHPGVVVERYQLLITSGIVHDANLTLGIQTGANTGMAVSELRRTKTCAEIFAICRRKTDVVSHKIDVAVLDYIRENFISDYYDRAEASLNQGDINAAVMVYDFARQMDHNIWNAQTAVDAQQVGVKKVTVDTTERQLGRPVTNSPEDVAWLNAFRNLYAYFDERMRDSMPKFLDDQLFRTQAAALGSRILPWENVLGDGIYHVVPICAIQGATLLNVLFREYRSLFPTRESDHR